MSNVSLSDLIRSMALSFPAVPSKWTSGYLEKSRERQKRRLSGLKTRISGVTDGRVMPDKDDITIGSGRQFEKLAILFVDICGFSSRPNWAPEDQLKMLATLNVFMAEMLSIVRDFGGTYEKNTGDGLMAYFGEGGKTDKDRVRPAVEAAVVMHYINDHLITPTFLEAGWPKITFRIGIEAGPVTIARVGIHGNNSSLVAIGTPANIACKLMNQIPEGGICIGHNVYLDLPDNWAAHCRRCETLSGFVYIESQVPYDSWELNHRLTAPPLDRFSSMLGGLANGR